MERLYKCPCCDAELRDEDLKWAPEVAADETGCYVVYEGYCPFCYEIATIKFGYKTTCDEPLKNEY